MKKIKIPEKAQIGKYGGLSPLKPLI